jgi:hypothetical protein
MKKSLAIATLLACAPVLSHAQPGSYDLKLCNTSEATVIDSAGGTTILATHARGLSDSMTPGGAFDNQTYECRSVANASKSGVEFTGRCTFVDMDGHKALGAFSGNPKGWMWKFLSGTGKYEGIEGGGTTKPLKQYPRLSPAVSGACAHATGSYTIRK